jgi:hypothetical protein
MNIKKIRAKVLHNISDETARAAGLSFEELRNFISGSYRPSDEQLHDLAAWLKMREGEFA